MSEVDDPQFVRCPYCGSRRADGADIFHFVEMQVDFTCDECGREFLAECQISVNYISRGKPGSEGAGE